MSLCALAVVYVVHSPVQVGGDMHQISCRILIDRKKKPVGSIFCSWELLCSDVEYIHAQWSPLFIAVHVFWNFRDTNTDHLFDFSTVQMWWSLKYQLHIFLFGHGGLKHGSSVPGHGCSHTSARDHFKRIALESESRAQLNLLCTAVHVTLWLPIMCLSHLTPMQTLHNSARFCHSLKFGVNASCSFFLKWDGFGELIADVLFL